jgi:class 3 adenylate cyclase
MGILLGANLVCGATRIEELEAQLASVAGKERAALLNELAQASVEESAENAMKYGQEALGVAREHQDAVQEAMALGHIGMALYTKQDYDQALTYFQQAQNVYNTLAHTHKAMMAKLQEQHALDKYTLQQDARQQQQRIHTLELAWRIILVVAFIALSVVGGIAAVGFHRCRQQLHHNQVMLQRAHAKSHELLHNILPVSIARELQKYGDIHPQTFDHVTVCFCDVFEFTRRSASVEPTVLFPELNTLFTAFDEIIEEHGCERLKTIGHAYLYVCGMPVQNARHAENVLLSAVEMLQYLKRRNQYEKMQWQIQVGIHTGRVIGGVVGIKKYIYEVFGETISIASAVKKASEPMRITISETTHERVLETFQCIEREPLEVKHQGMLNMYFVEGVKPSEGAER